MTAAADTRYSRRLDGFAADQPSLLACVLLVGGCVNGLAVRVLEAWQLHGLKQPLMGVSPFEIVALFVAAQLIAGPGVRRFDLAPWPELAFGAALLVPSSAAAWVAVAVYAAYGAVQTTHERRNGFILVLALATCSIWSSVILKWLAGPATVLEAHAAWVLLSPFRPDISATGNVVGVPEGHNLIVMTACTAASSLPKALLGLIALVKLAGGKRGPHLWAALAMVVGLQVAANTFRLALMASSGPVYAAVHGSIGANVFDALQTLMVVGLALWTVRS